jgi:hypothetical protein
MFLCQRSRCVEEGVRDVCSLKFFFLELQLLLPMVGLRRGRRQKGLELRCCHGGPVVEWAISWVVNLFLHLSIRVRTSDDNHWQWIAVSEG